jgi:hypothetical protein
MWRIGPTRRSTRATRRRWVRSPPPSIRVSRRAYIAGLASGASIASRSARIPSQSAIAVAVAPIEWAMIAAAGPCAATTSLSAAANSGIEDDRGPWAPGPDPPWLGASNATTRKPRATSGSTNAPSCPR